MKSRRMRGHPGELQSWTAMQIARRVCRALLNHRGNYRQAARELGVSRGYVYQVLRDRNGRMG